MKRFIVLLCTAALVLLSADASAKTPKYVIMMIGDGMGINHVTATQYYMDSQGMGDLNFYHFPVRTFVTTRSASSLVTDSAAAGTALSCGFKVNNGSVGWSTEEQPLENLVEKAAKKGYGTGVVSTDGICQATPATFSAHTASRKSTDDIAVQMLSSKIDFIAGGSVKTKEKTPEEWVAYAREQGRTVFCNGEKYVPCRGSRVLYLSDDLSRGDLSYAIDRKEGQTGLLDFTSAALDYLYGNFKNGFFLMVEGGNIDHASHSRDAACMLGEIIDFSKSVSLALEFYEKHRDETLLIVTSDHETGACMISGKKTSLLANQDCSVNTLTSELSALCANGGEPSWHEVKSLLSAHTGLWDKVPVGKEEERVFTRLYTESFLDRQSDEEKDLYHSNKKIAVEAVLYLAERSGVQLVYSSHTGAPVGLYAIGVNADKMGACRDNTDIPVTIAKIAGYK